MYIEDQRHPAHAHGQTRTLAFTNLWANSEYNKSMIVFFFFFSQENRIWHFMQIESIGDNLHGMPKPIFWNK